tara:strand:- start:3711 stop:4397 length:687 start_codon:yes stop_codon:yes gene_type:complete
MNSPPKISVLMSVYNDEKTLERSIESILKQTFKNFELLINDDSSTDDSFKIIKNFSNIDSRIKFFQNENNTGLTKSLNKLIGQSSGEFIARQDSDDTSHIERFQKQINAIESGKFDIVTTRANVIGEKRKIPNISFYFPKRYIIKYKNPFIHGSLLIKRNVLNDIGNYDEKFYYSQDYKLMSDLIKQNKKIKTLRQPLYNLNLKNNISSKNAEEQEYFAKCVRLNVNP